MRRGDKATLCALEKVFTCAKDSGNININEALLSKMGFTKNPSLFGDFYEADGKYASVIMSVIWPGKNGRKGKSKKPKRVNFYVYCDAIEPIATITMKPGTDFIKDYKNLVKRLERVIYDWFDHQTSIMQNLDTFLDKFSGKNYGTN